MSEDIKELSEITRAEWIKHRWQEVESTFGDESECRSFMKFGLRTPDEAAQAMDDWDSTAIERGFKAGSEG